MSCKYKVKETDKEHLCSANRVGNRSKPAISPAGASAASVVVAKATKTISAFNIHTNTAMDCGMVLCEDFEVRGTICEVRVTPEFCCTPPLCVPDVLGALAVWRL